MEIKPLRTALDTTLLIDSNALVYGLHWAPASETGHGAAAPANLDAICELRDARGILLEVISPDRPSSIDGSVIHTGDSRTGASPWDDERVFVFLDVLPDRVSRVDFRVLSRDGRPLCEVPGASCHVSDYRTEDELISVQRTALPQATDFFVATLHRMPSGWALHHAR